MLGERFLGTSWSGFTCCRAQRAEVVIGSHQRTTPNVTQGHIPSVNHDKQEERASYVASRGH